MNVNTYPSLAVALWPAQDAALWLAAKEAGDPLEKPGVASQWSPATVRMTESGYGSFLSWQLVRGQLDTDRRPIDRISQETVRAFIKDYEVGRAELTVAAAVRGVAYVFRATHPPHGIPWLTKLAHYMSNTAKPSKSKVDRMASVPELLDLADKLMKAGRSKFEDGRRSGGQTYRDGLMIAMLANRPLRVRNFAALKIGQALTWDAKNFHVVFSGAGETKKGNIIEFDLPRALIAPMRWYLDEARPILRERAKLPDDDLLVTEGIFVGKDDFLPTTELDPQPMKLFFPFRVVPKSDDTRVTDAAGRPRTDEYDLVTRPVASLSPDLPIIDG